MVKEMSCLLSVQHPLTKVWCSFHVRSRHLL